MPATPTITLDELLALKHQARGFSWLPRRPVESLLSGRFASRLRGRGLLFEEMRAYQPGDDIRQIDWKATARTRRTQLRVYTEERERPTLLMVDQRRSMFFGSRTTTKAVAAAQIAALTVWRVLEARDRVGAVIFNDEELIEITPQHTRRGAMRILAEIARLNQALLDSPSPHSRITLAEVFARAARHASHDYLLMGISDFRGLGEDTRPHAARMARHNDIVSVFVYDPLEAVLPTGSGLNLSGDDGEWLEFPDTRRARSALLESFSAEARTLRDRSLALRVPVIPIDSSRPVAPQLRRHIGTT